MLLRGYRRKEDLSLMRINSIQIVGKAAGDITIITAEDAREVVVVDLGISVEDTRGNVGETVEYLICTIT